MERIYISILYYIGKYPFLKKLIIFITQYFPYIIFLIYPCVLIYLLLTHSSFILAAILKPFFAFLLVTVFRKMINRPRPHETMNIKPFISHKNGESFPSRHTVSSMIIALICFPIHPYLGIFALIIAAMLSVSRILVGVHYISDVIVSIIIALIIYFI